MNTFAFLAISALCLNLVLSVEIVPESPVVKFNITKGATLQLQCNIKNGDGHYEMKWRKDETSIGEIDAVKARVTYTNTSITISDAEEGDVGNYSCTILDQGAERSAYIFAATTIYVNTPENVNVVEGEKLRIPCITIGNPPPQITWIVGGENGTRLSSSTDNIRLQMDPDSKVENAILMIDSVNMTDRGVYKCIGHSNITNETVEDEAMVRVKDKYAALWPFLGICLEVFVLCAIILIYEKKRNKSELEESDTDQSPDQKNTPDHGKDSNLRHRQ